MRVDLGRLTAAIDGAAEADPELAHALDPHRRALAELEALRVFEAAVLGHQSHQPRRDSTCDICITLYAVCQVRGELPDPATRPRLVPSRAKRGHR